MVTYLQLTTLMYRNHYWNGHQVSILLLQGCFISNSSIDPSKRLDDSAINGLESILNGNIPTADNLNVLNSLLEWPPSKYSSTARLFHK